VCLVVLTGPVGPTLCCPANGIRLGVWFLEGGTHFCTNIYTDDHCLSHSAPLLVTLACILLVIYTTSIFNDARSYEHKEESSVLVVVYFECGVTLYQFFKNILLPKLLVSQPPY
jgi:hypothetical protein